MGQWVGCAARCLVGAAAWAVVSGVAFAQTDASGDGPADVDVPSDVAGSPDASEPRQADTAERVEAGAPVPARSLLVPATGAVPVADRRPRGFDLDWSGYLRVSYERTQDDAELDFVGRNDGFAIQNARIHLDGAHRSGLFRFRIGLEGAAELTRLVNTPEGELDLRLRDAFLRYEATPWLGVQVGQMLAPFALEDLRSRQDLVFARAAVGQSGVPVGRGLQEVSMSTRRQIGLQVGAREPIVLGPVDLGYALMVANGNGENQLLNDNSALAFFGRVEIGLWGIARFGAAFLHNQRTEGVRPDRFDEDDLGWTVDGRVSWQDVHLLGQFARVQTSFGTTGVADRTREAWHVELQYRPTIGPVQLIPAYRVASYRPWRVEVDTAAGLPFDPSDLDIIEHTFGLGIGDASDAIRTMVAYTLAREPDARAVDNDRLEVLFQIVFP